jgi:hypothetical protein
MGGRKVKRKVGQYLKKHTRYAIAEPKRFHPIIRSHLRIEVMVKVVKWDEIK